MKDLGHEIADFVYYSPGIWDKECSFWPVRTGISTAKPGYSVGPKRIECYSMHFVREGSVELFFEGERRVLLAGDAFCLFPERTYTYRRWSKETALAMQWLAIDGPAASRMLRRAGFRADTPYVEGISTTAVQDNLMQIMKLMRGDGRTAAITQSLELQSELYRLFSLLIRGEQDRDDPAGSGWLDKSLEYIELHSAEGISVQDVAAYAGVNRTYFSTYFAKHVGISPIEYLTQVRMDKAISLLQQSTATITEIAYSLGYPNLFAFTRAFKNYTSMSPTAYRDKWTEVNRS